ncbi:hypothetical protein A2714_01510 [Candidatus Woesebacteria bacterium RIFCSPHIGHO2_01_FULL_38_9]|uniref:HTH cro/C1-type domain-containing protein n=2 Tax=Candidatus Woeseibacteriota TaxID=1752722 RepID=A0A1F7XYL4_9BACT|nr:MAG: hypothetical protein A2714_01510 [Candidatus Woesebacteria bacterium RIFCSPHIGHO2_01_FULL_38_9]OGM58602.1 MAG: hypothetical protein A3A75_01045 [Candidatus Woesebacteria bacterium RIFCSPLOWO2_01_FULL_39_10]
MKSIGHLIKEARAKKKLSKENLEKLTKIKKDFIEKLEGDKWDSLPEYPVVVGFVKNIAKALNLNEEHLLAFLRRDYPPRALPVNPKPDISEKFTWNPRLTFITGVVLTIAFIIGYLLFQYRAFIQPPVLTVETPTEGQVISEEVIDVRGKTDPDATVAVNNQPALIEENGEFVAEIEIFEGTQEIIVVARSRSGKETVIRRNIKPELNSQ